MTINDVIAQMTLERIELQNALAQAQEELRKLKEDQKDSDQ